MSPLGSCWVRTAIHVGSMLGPLCIPVGSILGRLWVHFGSPLGLCWVPFGFMLGWQSTMGPFWVSFGSILGPLWVHFGSPLGPLWVHFGSPLCLPHVPIALTLLSTPWSPTCPLPAQDEELPEQLVVPRCRLWRRGRGPEPDGAPRARPAAPQQRLPRQARGALPLRRGRWQTQEERPGGCRSGTPGCSRVQGAGWGSRGLHVPPLFFLG